MNLIKFHNIVTSQTPQMLHLYLICNIYHTKYVKIHQNQDMTDFLIIHQQNIIK